MGIFGSKVAAFGPFVLTKDSVKKTSGEGKGEHGLEGVTATVETGEELHRRVTLTRVALTGVFALALKKRTGGTSFLTVEGPGFAWVEEVGRKDKGDALSFAAKVRGAATAPPSPVEPVAASVAGGKPTPRRAHPSRR